MNFEEHAAKPLLRAAGIDTPKGRLAASVDEAVAAAHEFGRCVIKAQVPTGKRGKAGGIKLAASPDEARIAAAAILGMMYSGLPPADMDRIHSALVAGLSNGTLRPVVGKELPLADAARAHTVVMESGAFGKIVLVPIIETISASD
jgi:NADPH:quinone reductase-like Zn-dependent oxidoreductase